MRCKRQVLQGSARRSKRVLSCKHSSCTIGSALASARSRRGVGSGLALGPKVAGLCYPAIQHMIGIRLTPRSASVTAILLYTDWCCMVQDNAGLPDPSTAVARPRTSSGLSPCILHSSAVCRQDAGWWTGAAIPLLSRCAADRTDGSTRSVWAHDLSGPAMGDHRFMLCGSTGFQQPSSVPRGQLQAFQPVPAGQQPFAASSSLLLPWQDSKP